MIPWSLESTAVRVGILAAAVAIACAVSASVTWWGFATPRIEAAEQRARADVKTLEAEYQKGRADGEAAGRKAQAEQNERAQDASDERARELARLAGIAAARPPAVIRVCPSGTGPVPAPGGGPAGPAGGDGPAGGILPGATGSDPGAVLAARLRQHALEADAVSADLRAVLAACGGGIANAP